MKARGRIRAVGTTHPCSRWLWYNFLLLRCSRMFLSVGPDYLIKQRKTPRQEEAEGKRKRVWGYQRRLSLGSRRRVTGEKTRNDKGPRKTEAASEGLKFGICLRQGDTAADETASLLFQPWNIRFFPCRSLPGDDGKAHTLEIISGKKVTAWELVIPE